MPRLDPQMKADVERIIADPAAVADAFGLTAPTTDPRDGQPCAACGTIREGEHCGCPEDAQQAAANVNAAALAALDLDGKEIKRGGYPAPATVDGADLRAIIIAAIHADSVSLRPGHPSRIVHWPGLIADRIVAALTAAGWPDSYQPDNPHVAAAREARAEVERLTRERDDARKKWHHFSQTVRMVRVRLAEGSALPDDLTEPDVVMLADRVIAQRDAERERAANLARLLEQSESLDAVTLAKLRASVSAVAFRIHEALMARADYTRSQILDDLRRLVPDGPMPANNTAQPLYVDHEGKSIGEPRVDVTASVYLVPASPASSPTADPATPACTCYSGQFGKPHEQGCAALTDATETGADQ